LARAGLRSTIIHGDHLAIDKAEISNSALIAQGQGLEWFDRSSRLLGAQGITAGAASPPIEGAHELTFEGRTFDTFTTSIRNAQTGEPVGLVRASEWTVERARDIHGLDTGLAIGAVLAIVGSGLGGLALARRAVRPVTQTFRTLREFTADASHELRGPLTAIAGNADAALRDPDRDPERDRARFEAIADGAKQMSRLTSDLLLLAGADRSLEDDLYVIDLVALLQRIVGRFDDRFDAAGIELQLDPGHPVVVYGSPDQVERIIANLVENALRYTPQGGSVSITTELERNFQVVVVRDTGIGIAPEDGDRVFDRFWRADPSRVQEGTGLGLSIARALAQRHGGDVTVTSVLGSGSRFMAWFPTRPPRVD
jgi:OmpR-family two-component system manganese-sensing sensor histidine kinase